ncbi:MAG: sodium-translocating pyrophosphatase [Candidatus Diapherotrites archaeon]|nr:sodium-translocating pyrophosphatase [Candidatus Diapherotrites archaeon]
MTPETTLAFVIMAALFSIAIAIAKRIQISKLSPGNEKMQEIAGLIHKGSLTFLSRQYRYLMVFIVILGVIILAFFGPNSAFGFVLGAILSALAGNIGLRTATIANVRTAEALKTSLAKGFGVAFKSATVTGFGVVGLALLGLTFFYFFISTETVSLFCFALGASSIALFARVGGGIYTKAADVGADLVGKVEAGLPEDDPRNPAVIADNVGDNVGDLVGMSADMFQSYVATIVSAIVLASIVMPELVLLPFIFCAIGVIASFVGTIFVHPKKQKLFAAIDRGMLVSVAIMVLFAAAIVFYGIASFEIAVSFCIGLLAMLLIGYSTELITSPFKGPTETIARAAQSGAGTNVIAGLSLGMLSTAMPLTIVVVTMLLAFYAAGFYGIAIAVVGLLSVLALNLSADTYGSISDNAEGIAEMSGLGETVRVRAERLDAVGNSTAAIGKGFAISSAALTALVLFVVFVELTGIKSIQITDPVVMSGFLIGALIPFLFSALTMRSVGVAANKMVEEVRRQFKQIPGLLEGKAKADYEKCIGISTEAALNEMIAPSLLALILPILFALLFGLPALGSFLVGATITGFLLAVFMVNAGTGWDNAKKFIKAGHFGGKKSEAYKAAVVGDTVGDPFKDTAGPSLGILIKVMIVVSLVAVTLFL